MPSRRTEPDSRVMVFVDGQNLFKACERSYGRGQVHPIALVLQPTFFKQHRTSAVRSCQLPPTMADGLGAFQKPAAW
jgi:hypothetical protein